MLRACSQVAAGDAVEPAELVWVDEDWLVAQGVTQWTELPLWRNAAAPWGMNVNRAVAAGLRTRPWTETVLDTWKWLVGGGQPVAHERFAEHGIAPEREAALIERWLIGASLNNWPRPPRPAHNGAVAAYAELTQLAGCASIDRIILLRAREQGRGRVIAHDALPPDLNGQMATARLSGAPTPSRWTRHRATFTVA